MTESAPFRQVRTVLAAEPDPELVPDATRAGSVMPTTGGAYTLESPADFTRLFTEQFRYVYATLRRLGIAVADLEDATHDVFLSLYRHRADWDPARPLRPWIFAFAYRTAAAYRRTSRRRREVGDPELEAPSPDRDSLERLVQAQQLALVQRALLAVDLEHRAVLILHDLDDTPMPEVAQALGIALNTGYSRLRAGRRKFETALHRLQRRAQRGSPHGVQHGDGS